MSTDVSPTTSVPTRWVDRAVLDDPADVVARVRRAFDGGRTRPLPWRREQLAGLRRLLTDHADELTDAVAQDLGKSAAEAWISETGFTLADVRHTEKNLRRWAAPRRVTSNMAVMPAVSRVVPQPLGVVTVLSAWNYPLQLALAPVTAALAAGNAVILKPSDVASHTATALARLLPVELDSDAVAVVNGGVERTTELLAQRVDHVFYTGNSNVGRIVMEAAARHLTPVTLELGGRSPVIVDARCDLTVAARRIAFGKFMNAGQTCVAPNHVYVDRTVHDRLCTELVAAVRTFYGSDPRESPDYGRIVNLRHLERLTGLLGHGETVLCGGESDVDDRYLAPTVVAGLGDDHPVMAEEIFGPILPVVPVDSVDDATDRVNRGEKPLALYVFSDDNRTIDRVLDRTSSGGVTVNGTVLHLANPNLPFGGVGHSGMGAYHGRRGFDSLSHLRSVLTKATSPDPSIQYPPYRDWKMKVIKKLM